jgi:DNA-directed RNA polymerase subunit RPC12/RpoP
MSSVKEYKCLNCSAPLTFDPTSGKWKCHHCFSVFSKDELDEKNEDVSSENLDDDSELDSYRCSSCGAELIADKTTSATFCIYCKSSAIIKQRLSGQFKPKYVIPFKLTKDNAKSIYRTWIQKKLFAPSIFKRDDEIDKITGIYAPFWLFDCLAKGNTRGEGKKIRTWRSGDYEYTETKYYYVEREGNLSYEKIPVDASTKLDDKFMNMIEPYDYKELEDFSMHYMSGFMAERYDVEKEESQKVMKKRVEEFVNSRLNETISGYSSYLKHSSNTQLNDVEIDYALMPVYLIIDSYKDKKHMFLINGQTGKVVGETPIDHKKQLLFFLGISLGVFILSVLGGAFIA